MTKTNVLYVGICGQARAGKDTFASMLASHMQEYGNGDGAPAITLVRSLADPLRDMVMVLLEGEGSRKELLCSEAKEEVIEGLGASPRKLLQTLGTEWGRELINEDIWIHMLQQRVKPVLNSAEPLDDLVVVIVPDIRFENEAKFVDMLFQVIRDDTPEVREHVSEAGIPPHYITRTVTNNGTLEALDKKAQGAVAEVLEDTT